MAKQELMTDTLKAFDLHALNIARASEPMTKTQGRAIDLHKRGFNAFPIPYGKKEPFESTSLKRLYNSRVHLCGDGVEPCRHDKTAPSFASLFYGLKNIAVVCGKTSGNLLDIDCDTKAAYEDMGNKLDALGVPYWAFNSHDGRGGYLVRVIEGEAANVTKATSNFKDVELWGNSHYVIVPLSAHPSGEFYRWRGDGDPRFQFATSYQTLPAVNVSALEWLGVTLLKDEKKKAKPFESFRLSAEYFVLSERNRETLARGANDGERNRLLTALAYDLKGNDLEREDIEADFLHAASLCKPAYSRSNASSILKSAYAKTRTRARKDTNTGEPTAQIHRLYAFVNLFDWKGIFKRKARTRRAVFVACIERSAIEGETFRAAVRELAESVNRKHNFMTLCLRDLVSAGLLRLVTSWRKSSSGGNEYAFGEAVKLPPNMPSITTTCKPNGHYWGYSKGTDADSEKDVFGRLGDVAMQVLRALQANKYKSKYAIAKDITGAESSVSRAVDRLIKHGLAIHSEGEGLYYAEAVTDKELLTLSVKLQTNGRAEMQRITHGIDREIFINRNLSKAMRPFNDVTGEKRTTSPQQAEPMPAEVKPQLSKADKLRKADFEKILTAYREKMGEPSGAIKDILKDWQRKTYGLLLGVACEEDADGHAIFDSPDPLREWEKRRHEIKLDEEARRPLPLEDGWAFPVDELFSGYNAIGAILHEYKHDIGATLTDEAARFIWCESKAMDSWIISQTLREMKKKREAIRNPFAYMRKVVNDKHKEWDKECEDEEDE